MDLWVGKIVLEKEMATHSVFLFRKFHGQRSLAGYSPWGYKQSDTTEQLTLSLSNTGYILYDSIYMKCLEKANP